MEKTGIRVWVLGQESVDYGLDIRVAEGERLSSWGEDDYGDFYPTERAEFTGFLEETGSTFGERYLEVVFDLYFGDLDLLSTHARLLRHG